MLLTRGVSISELPGGIYMVVQVYAANERCVYQ